MTAQYTGYNFKRNEDKMDYDEREEMIEEAKKVLLKKGIKIDIGSCGCCDSPWVKIEVDGELVLHDNGEDVDGASFSMFDK